MKRYKNIWLLLFYAAIPMESCGQYVSLDEMFSLYNKDIDQINEYLIPKGWSFSESTEHGEETVWSYEPIGNGAQAWIALSTAGRKPVDSTVERSYTDFNLSYSTKNRIYYTKILSRSKEIGLKRYDSSISNSGIKTYYRGRN